MLQDYPYDMTPYPLCKRYGWEGDIRWTLNEMLGFLKAMHRQGGSDQRRSALGATMKALEQIYNAGKADRFTGSKVKELLVVAADEAGWYMPRHQRKAAHAPTETHKECAKCKQVKPREVFNAVATARQKEYYGWNVDSKRFVASKLCDVCRAAKLKRQRYLEKKRQERALLSEKLAEREPLLHKVAVYNKHIQTGINRISTTYSKHRVKLNTNEGPVTFLQFRYPDDEKFFEEKLRLLKLAKQRVNDAVGAGTVINLPDSGYWADLLTQDERDWLLTLWRQASWNIGGTKANAPKVFGDRPPTAEPTQQERGEQPKEHSSSDPATAEPFDWDSL